MIDFLKRYKRAADLNKLLQLKEKEEIYIKNFHDLYSTVKEILKSIPNEEETTITYLKNELNNIKFLLLPDHMPIHEEVVHETNEKLVYEILSECLPNNIDFDNLKAWQKEIINIWNNYQKNKS